MNLVKNISLVTLLLVSGLSSGQESIETTTPDTNVQTADTTLAQAKSNLQKLSTVSTTNQDNELIRQVKSTSSIRQLRLLDVDSLNVPLVNTVNYYFTNVSFDSLRDIDLQYDTNKYVVGIANFRYSGNAIKKNPDRDNYSVDHFIVRTFKNGGTWHLQIDNNDLDHDLADSLEYYVTLILYDKKYFLNLPTITSSLEESNTGTAFSIPIFK